MGYQVRLLTIQLNKFPLHQNSSTLSNSSHAIKIKIYFIFSKVYYFNMLQTLFQNPLKQSSLSEYSETIKAINSLEPKLEKLNQEELQTYTQKLKSYLLQNEINKNITIEAFALVREATKRVLGLRHFDVQLMGGLILNEGKIAEMKTGEGKTIVALLPTFLNALSGKGVHVVTANDYLARRDAKNV